MKNIRHILSSLPAFVESARLGSFTKASEKLGMSQPSVSRFIHNLEAGIGLSLFHRHHNQIKLTKDGKVLFDAVTLGMDHISSTIANLREVATGTSMTIGCTHGFSHMWLQQRFSKIQDVLPNHKVQIVTADHTNSLTLDDVSCVVRLGDGNWSDCDSKFLFSEQVFPVCTPEFAQQHGITDTDKLNPKILQDLPLLVQDDGKRGWLGWPEWFSHHGITYYFEPDQKPINNYGNCPGCF